MGRIVAIAGGDLVSTRELNLHTIRLTKKTTPNVLFIGTASHDAEGYIESITEAFRLLNCKVKSLCLCSRHYKNSEIDSLLAWADIIYVGGGNTIFMMQQWKQYGLDEKLKAIYAEDSAVLTGLSAGAVCWFSCGHSDSGSQDSDHPSYCWADELLDIFPFAFCPHYDDPGRKSFDTMLAEKDLMGLAMESNTAFVADNGRQYFIRSLPDAKAYLIQYIDGIMDKKEAEFSVY